MLEGKKEIFLELIQLGMDPDKASLIAELSEEQVKELSNDESFNNEIACRLAYEEKRLLDIHMKACQIQASKGSTSGIQWKLSKLNPDRWGDKKTEIAIPGSFVIDSDDEKLG